MPIERLALIGAGGHAKVVLDALRRADSRLSVELFDESAANAGHTLGGITIRLLYPALSDLAPAAHIAIGDAAARERLAALIVASGRALRTVAHPAASVASSANIGEGAFLAALCVVAAEATIGRGVIVNHGAVVDHECRIGDWSHIAPNATLGGAASVGRSAMIGAGASLLPGVRIGDRAVIGAGSVVLHDVPADAVFAGVPARALRRAAKP